MPACGQPRLSGSTQRAYEAVTGCCAPSCRDDSVPDAPVPLCARHLRKTFEFAADMAGSSTLIALAGTTSATIKRPPVTDAPEPAADGGNGWVYFIRFADRIKIGWSAQPYRRIAVLPHDEVLAIVPGTIADEQAYHQRFSAQRVHGEWFTLSQELVDLAATLDTGKRPWSRAARATTRRPPIRS